MTSTPQATSRTAESLRAVRTLSRCTDVPFQRPHPLISASAVPKIAYTATDLRRFGEASIETKNTSVEVSTMVAPDAVLR
jgi:hypothetical protein